MVLTKLAIFSGYWMVGTKGRRDYRMPSICLFQDLVNVIMSITITSKCGTIFWQNCLWPFVIDNHALPWSGPFKIWPAKSQDFECFRSILNFSSFLFHVFSTIFCRTQSRWWPRCLCKRFYLSDQSEIIQILSIKNNSFRSGKLGSEKANHFYW